MSQVVKMEKAGQFTKAERDFWKGKAVLVTGGTGSFGKKFIQTIREHLGPRKVVVFSRDELKQFEMRASGIDGDDMRYFLGDIRDQSRLSRALSGIDVVVHAAALKQVPSCEYNPYESILTNIVGTRNIMEAALDQGVERVIALSTDKAVNPLNLYGATKLCAEKLVVHSNSYSAGKTKFGCVRYGNVVGSRGSVVPIFLEQKQTGVLTVTDARMTRFWMTIEESVRFVIRSSVQLTGGEIFVPKIPSTNVTDLAKAIAPDCQIKYVGTRPGEKLHEVLISEGESAQAIEFSDRFIIYPINPSWQVRHAEGGSVPATNFSYDSLNNGWQLGVEEIRTFLAQTGLVNAAGKKAVGE